MSILGSIGRSWHRRATALAVLLIVMPQFASAAGSVAWKNWTFDYDVSGLNDGLSLKAVKYQGRTLINKISLPVMRVFYDNNACGPYADRLGGTLSPISWMNNAMMAQREFTLNGELWYEIGIRDQIGSYDIYQVYYLSEHGVIDAHIYSKGLQCVVNHVHYPNWRVDFDLDGSASDQILRDPGTGYAVMTQEFNAPADSAASHAWRVRDSSTGLSVDVLPGFPDFTIPGTGIPNTNDTSHSTVFGRLYKSAEDTGWTYGPNTQVPYNDGESIDNTDVILWYEAYLPHAAADGSELWHSTGIRLVSSLATAPPPPPPPGTTVTQSFSGAGVNILDKQPGSPYPSTINVANVAGSVYSVSVALNGLTHTYPDDLDIALVGPGGQTVMLTSDAGGGGDVNGVNLTFDDGASASIGDTTQVVSGSYRPVNYAPDDVFPAPGPSGTLGTALATFTGTNPNGAWKLYVLDDAGNDIGTLSGWTLTLTTVGDTPPPPPPPPPPTVTQSFTGGALTILDKLPASPYPSTINVANMTGTITNVTVAINGLTHTYPDDLDIALVAPGGQNMMLMSDAGGGGDVNGVSLTFEDSASGVIGDSTQVVSGTYRPVNYAPSDALPAPGPAGILGNSLGAFTGANPNGNWQLFLLDDGKADVGTITGWTLTITTQQ